MTHYSQAEKMEIIHLVETSELPVKQTLAELDVPRSTFYEWYRRYLEAGQEGLAGRQPQRQQFWNRIPDNVREQVVEAALEKTELSPRQLAWHLTDTQGYFISESSVYRILKGYDLVTSPVFQIVSAKDKFEHPTQRINELWQTDFTQFKVVDWGYYYLCTVLDDYSRFILAWRLAATMGSSDVEETLNVALAATGVSHIKVHHRPRLLSDNGPAFVSEALQKYLKHYHMAHTRGAPYHPQTQGKIERYHRSMKSIVKLDLYYAPSQLEQAIASFVHYYNHERYHESLDNVTPADMYFGRYTQVTTQRERIKHQTLQQRREQYLQATLYSG
jgi:transposase InsO family protein